MDNVMIVTVLVFLIFSFIEFLLGFRISRTRRKYIRIVSNERIREEFSYARQNLIKLVADGELDPNSYTFKTFYKIHSFILRNPDRYEVLGTILADAIIADSPKDVEPNLLKEESKRWSKNMQKVAMATGKGFAIIIDEFAPLLRFLPRLEAKMIIFVANLPERPLKEIKEAEDTMYKLAADGAGA